MAFTVNEIGTLTVVTGGGFAGDYATGWSATNYYHITDLDTAGSAQLHSFVIFYKGTQTDAGANGELAIPLFGDKDNTGGITLGIDGGYLAISDGTTITRGSTLINDDDWHPIIFAVGDTTVKGYADGDLEVDVTPSNLSTVIINAIGNSAGASAYPSALDGIQIYDTFLFPFMVTDFQSNIYAGSSGDSLSFTFITDPMVIYNRTITEAPQYIEHGFQDISVQSVKALGNQEEAIRNVTVKSENFIDVYNPQLEGNEQDLLSHKKRVLRIFYQEQITKERWS